VWIHDDENCRASLQEFEQVRRTFQGDEEVVFYVVCTQPSSVSNAELQQLLEGWRVLATPVRDLTACGRDVFRIPGAPTLVVLNQRGVVQTVEAGFNPNLAAELPQVLRRIQAGDDLGGQILAQFQQEQADYARELAAAGGAEATRLLEAR
jgi:hypothetical protein